MEKHIENQVIFARAQYPQRKGAKLVYAVNCQLGFKLARMLEILIGDEEADQKDFYDYTEAEKWLTNTALPVTKPNRPTLRLFQLLPGRLFLDSPFGGRLAQRVVESLNE